MRIYFRSFFLSLIFLISLIEPNLVLGKKKELQNILLGFLLGNTILRGNSPQFVPHMMNPHNNYQNNGGHPR